MTKLQRIRAKAKEHNLKFIATKNTHNGAELYKYVNTDGNIEGSNWTIDSAFEDLFFSNISEIDTFNS